MIYDSKAVDNLQKEVLRDLMKIDFLNSFYLAGGTNLAFRYEHRKSVDLDLFCTQRFNMNKSTQLSAQLKEYFGRNIKVGITNEVGVFSFINNIKVDFVLYPYKLLNSIEEIEGVRMGSSIDIGAMKINAIIGRGTKKDFYDLNELLKYHSLNDMLESFKTKYLQEDTNIAERSLIYFDSAEDLKDKNNSVLSLNNESWENVKKNIIQAHKLNFRKLNQLKI